MRLDQDTIKLCYSTHRHQTVVRIDYAYDAEPYSATSLANILTEACGFVEIKLGVVPLLFRNLIEMHLQVQKGDLSYIQE